MEPKPFIPKHDGYWKLKSFQVGKLSYDVTVRFGDRYISLKSQFTIRWWGGRAVGYRTSWR